MADHPVTDHGFMRGPFSDSDGCTYRGLGSLTCGEREEAHAPRNRRVNLPPEPATGEAETAFAAYAEAVQALVRVKDRAYGGAWQKQGYMGNLARIMSKAARLEAMMWRDEPESFRADKDEETVMDTLKDLMALAAFCAANIEDGNRWGR